MNFDRYDQWKTASPYDDCPDEPRLIHCGCGAFLKHEPDSSEWIERKETVETIDGETCVEDYSYTLHHRKCGKCGLDNLDPDY